MCPHWQDFTHFHHIQMIIIASRGSQTAKHQPPQSVVHTKVFQLQKRKNQVESLLPIPNGAPIFTIQNRNEARSSIWTPFDAQPRHSDSPRPFLTAPGPARHHHEAFLLSHNTLIKIKINFIIIISLPQTPPLWAPLTHAIQKMVLLTMHSLRLYLCYWRRSHTRMNPTRQIRGISSVDGHRRWASSTAIAA
jgi:hypothetical protein